MSVLLRQYPRWVLHAAVDLQSQDCLYAGLSYDVSAGGIFVATLLMPPIGSMVGVNVTLPDGQKLELFGTIRWLREPSRASAGLPAGCGIEWVALDDQSLRSLMRFAELREPILWEGDEAA